MAQAAYDNDWSSESDYDDLGEMENELDNRDDDKEYEVDSDEEDMGEGGGKQRHCTNRWKTKDGKEVCMRYAEGPSPKNHYSKLCTRRQRYFDKGLGRERWRCLARPKHYKRSKGEVGKKVSKYQRYVKTIYRLLGKKSGITLSEVASYWNHGKNPVHPEMAVESIRKVNRTGQGLVGGRMHHARRHHARGRGLAELDWEY